MLAPTLLVAGVGEGARRLLTPRSPVRAPVPVRARDHFSEAEIARGREYARPQARIGLLRSALETGLLVGVVLRPPTGVDALRAHPRLGGATVAAGLSLGLSLPGLPLRALARQRSLSAGLSTGTWRTWAGDLAKLAVIQTGVSGAVGAGAIALSARRPRRWGLGAGLVAGAAGALVGTLAPVLLEPLFNDFTPLPDNEIRADLLTLADAAGVRIGEVYSVDASRRTSAANAYVSGLGPTKRVVLYDTMLDRYTRPEIRLVVAHELAHVRHRDVLRNLAFVGLIAPAVTVGAQHAGAALAGRDPRAPLTPAALPALGLAASLVSAPLGPIAARLSRALEIRADDFSLRVGGEPSAFVSFERRAALQNLADLEPTRLSRLLASHPPTLERIGAALAHTAATG